jgi:hypothetical protein
VIKAGASTTILAMYFTNPDTLDLLAPNRRRSRLRKMPRANESRRQWTHRLTSRRAGAVNSSSRSTILNRMITINGSEKLETIFGTVARQRSPDLLGPPVSADQVAILHVIERINRSQRV